MDLYPGKQKELKFYLKDAEVFGFKGNLTLSPDRYKIPKKYPTWW